MPKKRDRTTRDTGGDPTDDQVDWSSLARLTRGSSPADLRQAAERWHTKAALERVCEAAR